ncbi:MAG: ADOP family duplicated permease [Longimicrobiales bacterium]
MAARIRSLLGRLRALLTPGSEASEQEDEFRFHLAMETEANLREGMSPEEARRRALAAFGGLDWHAERVREARRGALLDDLIRDIRFGLRNLRKRPVFALAAILTLSLGIGMTTTMFTLVDSVLLSPLPGSNTRGLVYLGLESADGQVETSPTPELLRLIRDHASSFSRVEAYTTEDINLILEGEPHREKGARASVGFFSFLGITPGLGRAFLPEDGQGTTTPAVVLSHAFWVERFGGGRDALGRTLDIDGVIQQVVGVLPRDFRVDAPEQPLFWIPEGAAGALLAEGVPVEGALARLTEGVSPEAARSELSALIRNNPLEPLAGMEWVGRVRAPGDLIDPSVKQAILIFQVAAFLVLLIGCGNLTNLLLAQGETRARELALRASLGAGRRRLVRQLLVESLVLGTLGGGGGILLTLWSLGALPFFLASEYGGAVLNGKVFLFASLVSLLSVLGVGLLPALRGSGRDPGEVIKGSTPFSGTFLNRAAGRHLLVTAEVAMAFVLLTTAGLLLKSFSGLMASDVGFDSRDLLALRLELPEERYADPEAQLAFFDRLFEDVRQGFPGQLGAATLASGLVDDLAASFRPLVPEGAVGGEEERLLHLAWKVAPGFFDVTGVPILQGRGFGDGDGLEGEKVVILNETLAGRYFPGEDPVGRRLKMGETWFRVVGVAGSVNLPALARNRLGELQIFLPFRQEAGDKLTLLARVGGDRSAALNLLKQMVWEIDGSLPIVAVSLVEDALAESLAQERSNALLMVLFALTALVLGAVGVYGVVAYSVSRRIREIGIRMALGASRREVLRRVVLGGMKGVGFGLVLGGAGSAALGKALSGLLVQVSPRDPAILLLVLLLTASVALLSTWLPARRAVGSGPVEALRGE